MNEFSSAKKRFAQRCHQPLALPQENLHAATIINPRNDDESVGRRHFDGMYSLCEEFKPGCRLVSHRLSGFSDLEANRGRKYISPSNNGGQEIANIQRKHSNASQRLSDASALIRIGWTRKHNVLQDGGIPAALRESNEYDMESYMNRKQRIRSELQQRNDIPVAIPGDRPFRDADREPGFYAKGGLIPGSSIQMRKSAKPTFKKKPEESVGADKSKAQKSTMSYEQRQEILERDYDRKQVTDLTVREFLSANVGDYFRLWVC
jgi:hypothetical protein